MKTHFCFVIVSSLFAGSAAYSQDAGQRRGVGDYFVGLLLMSHFGNASFSSSI